MRIFFFPLFLLLLSCMFNDGNLFAQESGSPNAVETFEKVQRILRNPADDWQLAIELNHLDGVYQTGQNLTFTVHSPRRCYLHVFNPTPKGELNRIWPTDAHLS